MQQVFIIHLYNRELKQCSDFKKIIKDGWKIDQISSVSSSINQLTFIVLASKDSDGSDKEQKYLEFLQTLKDTYGGITPNENKIAKFVCKFFNISELRAKEILNMLE